MSANQITQYSLIFRAIDLADEKAWDALFRKYSRFIYYILHELNIDKNDVDDVHQQVMVILMRDLKKYDREKARFRTWLSAVIRSTSLMHCRKRDSLRAIRIRIEDEFQNLEHVQKQVLDDYIEKEWKRYVMSLAMKRVRKSFAEESIRSFELGLAGKSAAEISQQTGESREAIYTHRKRVKKSLMIAIKSIIHEIEW